MSLTAAAGPVSNILLSLLFIIISKIIIVLNTSSAFLGYFAIALLITAQISVYLAVFNLIPIPPLDGSKILMFFMSNRMAFAFERNLRYIRIILIVLILAPYPFNIVGQFIGVAGSGIMYVLNSITFFIK